LNRHRWRIENRLHCVPNLAFDEDRCCIRKHAGAQVMASPRKLALSLGRLIFEFLGLS
jgi:predicted transposase YbfD/YdcC